VNPTTTLRVVVEHKLLKCFTPLLQVSYQHRRWQMVPNVTAKERGCDCKGVHILLERKVELWEGSLNIYLWHISQ
jgi:hypothetical protein